MFENSSNKKIERIGTVIISANAPQFCKTLQLMTKNMAVFMLQMGFHPLEFFTYTMTCVFVNPQIKNHSFVILPPSQSENPICCAQW
ncbi:hypothetical protein CW304_11810 [Bacillus sp. UFRGS-B20]|nr:hypothetical protein CW304_11810 [Bacillus sp. UFRGS-B20]